MIEEVLKNVKNAEAEADKIIAEAEEVSAAIRLAADNSYAEITENAKIEAKRQAALIALNAETEADNNFKESVLSCQKDCEKLLNGLADKIEILAQEVYGRVKG